MYIQFLIELCFQAFLADYGMVWVRGSEEGSSDGDVDDVTSLEHGGRWNPGNLLAHNTSMLQCSEKMKFSLQKAPEPHISK